MWAHGKYGASNRHVAQSFICVYIRLLSSDRKRHLGSSKCFKEVSTCVCVLFMRDLFIFFGKGLLFRFLFFVLSVLSTWSFMYYFYSQTAGWRERSAGFRITGRLLMPFNSEVRAPETCKSDKWSVEVHREHWRLHADIEAGDVPVSTWKPFTTGREGNTEFYFRIFLI